MITGVLVTPGELKCPACGELNPLPHGRTGGPVLRAAGRVWLPTIVAIRCNGCHEEVRLP